MRHFKTTNTSIYVGFFQLLVGLLLTAIAVQRIDTYHDYHKALADHSVLMASDEINRLIGEKRRLLHLFTDYEKTLIHRLITHPQETEIADKLNERVLSYFPDAINFTLVDDSGQPLIENFEGQVGVLCQQEIVNFSLEHKHHPQLHPTYPQYHYDIMVHLDSSDGYIFFVSFQTSSLQNLLRLSGRPYHQLVLLNTETPNLIEVTANGNRHELGLIEPVLKLEEQSRILAHTEIPDTHWMLVDIGDGELMTNFSREVVQQAVLVFIGFLFSSAIMVLLIMRGDRQRLIAEQALYEAKEQLEIDVHQRTQELRESKELAETTLSSISDGVITTDTQGRITSMNRTAAELLERHSESSVGQALAKTLQLQDEESEEEIALPLSQHLSQAETKQFSNRPLRLITDSDETKVVQISLAGINNHESDLVGNVLVIRDITDSHRMNHQLTWQATHDTLTGLINRMEFENRLRISVKRARADQANHALMFLDLDQFKVVNDTCGHIAGDQLLRQVATMLTETARRNDMVARLGGDEFAILLEYCPIPQALTVAEQIRTRLRNHRFTWDDKPFTIGVSIGVVSFNESYSNLTEILSTADSACYSAKEAGRNRVHLYAEDDKTIEDRYGEMQWVSRLRHALDDERFVLFCQKISPINDASQTDENIEILVRLEERDGQLAPPGAFIPAAERYGMMLELDRFVVKKTLKWLENSTINGFVSINLSAQSITDSEFITELLESIIATNISPSCLLFEVTETATISNLFKARYFIEQLKGIGCRFALDDFGSGMSSFGYLKNLPVDFIKIDGEFVRDITSDSIDFSIVKAINEVAHNMGMKTVAEYVEDIYTLEMLGDIGVDYAQGYGIERPICLLDFKPDDGWQNRMDSLS